MTDAATAPRVLKASDLAAGRRAGSQADLAAALAVQAREDELAASYREGVLAGRAAVEQEAAGASLRAAAALDAIVAAVSAVHAAEVDSASRAVLASALDLTAWVLRGEVSASSRSLLARLSEGAQALLPSPTCRVLVAPADADAVTAWAAGRSSVEVVVDAALQPGDAVLETDAGSVDVSVAAALRIAAETLGVDPARGVR